MSRICLLLCLASIFLVQQVASSSEWSYICQKGNCLKVRAEQKESAISLGACRLMCSSYASLWPKPTGKMEFKKSLIQLNVNSIDVLMPGEDTPVKRLVSAAAQRFKKNIDLLAPENGRKPGGRSLVVNLHLKKTGSDKVVYQQDETYSLNVSVHTDGRIISDIEAENFYGARNGLESLSQLIIWDDIRSEYQMLDSVYLKDGPVYPHRGILLDTARNFISTDSIKRTIEAMGASKLNIFHWHITDSQSFPYTSKSAPYLTKLGAYTPSKVYSSQDVDEIIAFGKVRGVKVLPEFDAPAHVGEGWQDTGYLACFDKKPWQKYCVEPPCGQLDPTQDGMYDVLELIYKDMIEQFDPDIFHMGGDEVHEGCWDSERKIAEWMTDNNYTLNEAGFIKLWDKFQREALKRFTKQRGYDVPIILWTSTLTDEKYLMKYLPNSTYIIQIWTTGSDKQIRVLLENGYRTILSNYDALYFDCGFGSWVADGNNWCSPYIGWQKVYENSPAKIAGKYSHLMMGAEAALWTEQSDDASVDGRIWPRAAALAERLWAEPKSTWKDAEDRFMIHRERLLKFKVNADSLQPEWCRQHQGSCSTDGILNMP
ncbi:PREDICTED: chitooligosaccharidolytic beta-N-acetylglucosaminidase [Nicrophorus vespilloides]|uniref:Beta-hexosaminidase n=1 Tax=Nicrophorus vespilloides TaxID=110193 RepID=A0ABM1MBL5_NICVS|nr:PREDICTED: chitooligosaccharidolytic beta-N-acetylglucosaminidase [Nicrophorus vespilloides]XP_017771964.1 PREDICTED: chitooligosaccharidolytic beta-N-acetylglucosaminidase [Nicrophorus vespilloides]XP_017771965.1 PREDICTED: chitooligosaccharidolytic beta-N-acetylglucosaminidase [Nicrophorus vespilloides]